MRAMSMRSMLRVPVAAAMAAAAAAVMAAMLQPATASAAARSYAARGGGVAATLSFVETSGIDVKNERLRITAPGMPTYDKPVPASGCFKVCDPGNKPVVQVVDLYGDGQYEVVLDLWTGGADCCGLVQVYVPSAAMHSWVLSSRNVGHYGAALTKLGGREVFVSADNDFYCTFISCAASGLPVQVLSFTGDAFHDVTRSYPALIARDAASWLKLYYRHLGEGEGVLAAWAADEYNLGRAAAATSMLNQQVAARHISRSFVRTLQTFLTKHGYLGAPAGSARLGPASITTTTTTVTTTQTASGGGVTATFSFQGKLPNFTNLRLRIAQSGTVLYDAPVVVSLPGSCFDTCWPGSPQRNHPSVSVVYLEPSGTPQVLLDLYSGGAHCCWIAQVYSYDATTNTYEKSEHNFGDPGYAVKDFLHNGQLAFLSADDSFAYAFTDFAASGMPIQIWSFAGGNFIDVTRLFPALIAKDAAAWWTAYQKAIKYGDDTGLIAAWAADEELLGHKALVDQTLAKEQAAGHLRSPLTGGGAKFVAQLKQFLKAHRYTSG